MINFDAISEVPPISKKLSVTPTLSRSKISAKASAKNASISFSGRTGNFLKPRLRTTGRCEREASSALKKKK